MERTTSSTLVLIPGLKDDVMVQGLHQLYARCAHRRPVVVDLVWPASLEALLDIPVIEFTHVCTYHRDVDQY